MYRPSIGGRWKSLKENPWKSLSKNIMWKEKKSSLWKHGGPLNIKDTNPEEEVKDTDVLGWRDELKMGSGLVHYVVWTEGLRWTDTDVTNTSSGL